jgi:hypothetical protein
VNDLLVILNPRRIEECIRPLLELDIDRLWVKNMSEARIAAIWSEILELAAPYDRLIVQSDDGVVRPHALVAVQELLDDGHPVVTGWSNLSGSDFRANLTKTPLGPAPAEDAYDLYTMAEVMEYPDIAVPTFLVGMALTGMSVELWEEFPFKVFPVDCAQTDFYLSKRLEEADIPMVGARDGFVWHVKQVWNKEDTDPRKQLLVAVEPPDLVLDESRMWVP